MTTLRTSWYRINAYRIGVYPSRIPSVRLERIVFLGVRLGQLSFTADEVSLWHAVRGATTIGIEGDVNEGR